MARIQGFATLTATKAHAKRFQRVQHAVLGRTALHCSQAGFGCYRMADGVQSHRKALEMALDGGINLIDTSTNYADGESEVLVGKVLSEAIRSRALQREEIIVVSKVGYLQGRNYALSQDRKAEGRPFPELVPYADGLEHCLHPSFIEDQLNRSLERLNLSTVDVYLLHNPEYYLNWAATQGKHDEAARAEYDRRLLAAFHCLEAEAQRGRIRYYGISSNTFPAPSRRKDYTGLQRVLELAQTLGPEHRFAVVQFPMNLLESGAILTANQPDGATLLTTARRAELGTLVNRPLNAIGTKGLLRLADVEPLVPRPAGEIVHALENLAVSEATFVRDILPNLEMSEGLRTRIETQVLIAAALKDRYAEFPSYDAWCQIRDRHLLPRVNGVLAYCEAYPRGEHLGPWTDKHRRILAEALAAVTSLHAQAAADRGARIQTIVREADPDWRGGGSLSQTAIRALRSTEGISSVLVGMRQPRYVQDVLKELSRFTLARPRTEAWRKLGEQLFRFEVA